MKTCPFFNICGGCKYDFAAPDYRAKKLSSVSGFDFTDAPHWCPIKARWRADFCFGNGKFGFYAKHSKDIVPITNCPLLLPQINAIIPSLSALDWAGTGSCLVTACENGLDVCVTSNVEYFTPEFKAGALKLPVIRTTWNGRVVMQTATPMIKFGTTTIEYPAGAFLQPMPSEVSGLRDLVMHYAKNAHKVADLFCGLGNFTFELNADGFDIVGTGVKRDLFKHPLTVGMLRQYDCVIMDPPRAGAFAQCGELAKSNVARIIYVSCNPETFSRDMGILISGGYRLVKLIPVDQFVGSAHWEFFSVFEK